MYKGIQLSASLMCIDWLNAGNQLMLIEECGVDYLHLDVIDGNFAPDFTMGSSIINCFKNKTKMNLDYHLMVEEPSRLVDAFEFGQSDNVTIHQECSRNLHRDLVKIKQRGAKVGVALAPGTPLETLEYVLEDVDLVLVMSVNPGYMGQPLVPQAIRKVEKLKKLISEMNLNIKISVDGSINAATIPEMVSAGADILVLGSSGLFRKDGNLKLAVEEVLIGIDNGMKGRDEQL